MAMATEATLAPVSLGKVTVDPPLVLAPLAGHTDRAFRRLVKDLGGCGLVVTEMVSSEGLTRGSEHSREIAAITSDERPVGVQIFGCDPVRMGDAAAMVAEMGADLVDVNMGCPVPKVTKTGAGAALMQNVEQAAAIISRMVRSTGIPVTVKIRSGWDQSSINAPEVARALEAAGAAAITVHPRCRSERHRGPAAWPVIAEVKRAVRIPVIGNGSIHTAADAIALIEATGADGVMVGRGALQNPWVFRQMRNQMSGEELFSPKPDDYRSVLERFLHYLSEYLPERVVVYRMKALIGWYTKGLPGGAELRTRVYAAQSLEDVVAAFEAYFPSTGRHPAPQVPASLSS
jgi:nifR3 family TIM-barrel protein